MARWVVKRRSALAKPLPAVPADRDAQPSAFSKEDDATIEVRTLLLLRLTRRWRGAARQSAWQAHLDGISADSDVVPTTGHMPVILEVFCRLHGASLLQFFCQILRPQGRAGQGSWAAAQCRKARRWKPCIASLSPLMTLQRRSPPCLPRPCGDDPFSTVNGQAGILIRVVHPSGSLAEVWRFQTNPVPGEHPPETSQLDPFHRAKRHFCLPQSKPCQHAGPKPDSSQRRLTSFLRR